MFNNFKNDETCVVYSHDCVYVTGNYPCTGLWRNWSTGTLSSTKNLEKNTFNIERKFLKFHNLHEAEQKMEGKITHFRSYFLSLSHWHEIGEVWKGNSHFFKDKWTVLGIIISLLWASIAKPGDWVITWEANVQGTRTIAGTSQVPTGYQPPSLPHSTPKQHFDLVLRAWLPTLSPITIQ